MLLVPLAVELVLMGEKPMPLAALVVRVRMARLLAFWEDTREALEALEALEEFLARRS